MEQLNNHPVVRVYQEKRDYELNQLSELPEPVSLDGLLHVLKLSDQDERMLVHNVADAIRIIINSSGVYDVESFLSDCQKYQGKPELRYATLFEKCPELSLLLDGDFLEQIIALVSSYAAKQHYFLIDIMDMEMRNGVTYAVNEKIMPLSREQIKRYIFNLQPNKSYQKDVSFDGDQLKFLSMMLLNKAIMIAEGVFMAENMLSSEFGFNFY